MKALATLLAVLAVAATASAQQNNVTFNQTQTDDGLFHLELGVSYAFQGLPPRTNNSGVGTVRFTLPEASVTVESVDAGYQCVTEGPGTITCTSDGQPQGDGTAFPPSMTVRLLSRSCWAPEGQTGSADVWAAPKDLGGSPDVTLTIQPGGCQPDPDNQPVLDTKETCKVPNVKNMTLAAATRELKAADCQRGRIAFAFSPKVKKGRVMKQAQRPGKTLKFRSKVNLVISKGKKK